MGNAASLHSSVDECLCFQSRSHPMEPSDKHYSPLISSKASSTTHTPQSPSNPQENPQTSARRSSVELLSHLDDSAYKSKSLRFAHLDDALLNDLITDEEYALKMRELNLSLDTSKMDEPSSMLSNQ